MTVFHLISSEGFFGAEAMLVTLAASLKALGCDVSIGVFEDSRQPHLEVADRARDRGLSVQRIPCEGRLDWRAVRLIHKALEEYRPDVLHTHGYKSDLYGLAARPRRVALVASCHNWPGEGLALKSYYAFDRCALRGFERVCAVSNSVATLLKQSGVRRVSVIPNGVEIDRFANAEPRVRAELRAGQRALIGFVGRFVQAKGGETLIRAAARVLRAFPEAQFVFAGDGPERGNWASAAAAAGIADRVVFLGVREDIPDVYASLDILALPSDVEATPMCVLEAMASGKAVIGTRVGDVPKLVTEGVTGLLTDPGSPDQLADQIEKLLGNDGLRARLGTNARIWVTEHASADRMARDYVDVYRRAVRQAVPLQRLDSVGERL